MKVRAIFSKRPGGDALIIGLGLCKVRGGKVNLPVCGAWRQPYHGHGQSLLGTIPYNIRRRCMRCKVVFLLEIRANKYFRPPILAMDPCLTAPTFTIEVDGMRPQGPCPSRVQEMSCPVLDTTRTHSLFLGHVQEHCWGLFKQDEH